MDRYGYIGIETLLNFCENSKDHAVTPNDFMRMKRVRVPERKKVNGMAELKPCPFCGGTVSVQLIDPRLYRPSMNHPFAVVCYACDLLFGYDEDYGGRFDSGVEAIETWNRRAGEQS